MNSSSIRALASLAVASLAVTGVASTAEATVTYANRGSVDLYELVEAQYTSDGSHVLVLSNDTSNAVLQKIDPGNKTVADTLEFTAPNTDGTNAWSDAVDMAVAADGSFAYIVFNDSDLVLAKVNLSSMEVVDYRTLADEVNSSTLVRFVSLEASDAMVRVIGNLGSRTFFTDSLDFDTNLGNTSIGSDIDPTLTNLAFAYDSRNSAYAFSDLRDYCCLGTYVLMDNLTNYGPALSSTSALSAIAIKTNNDGEWLFAGNDQAGADRIFRSSQYLTFVNEPAEEFFSLPTNVDGVRQIVVSDNAEQLVALSKDKKLIRVPLGRGWFAGLIDVISVADSGATLGSDPLIAVNPDGSTVTYLDENNNIINFSLADNAPTVAQPVELDWYVYSRKNADLAWSISPDLGDSTFVSYTVQCTNGKTNRYRNIAVFTDNTRDIVVTRNKKKTIKCRVLVTNEVGVSAPSNVVKVTARGKRGPRPGGGPI
jgi:hypothetical protein